MSFDAKRMIAVFTGITGLWICIAVGIILGLIFFTKYAFMIISGMILAGFWVTLSLMKRAYA